MSPQETAKERILKAAIELADERSSQFIQLRDVAEAAGVSSSLVVFHFKSLEDLMVEVRLRRWEEVGVPTFKAWLSTHQNAEVEELLLAMISRDLERGHRSRDLMSMSWWWSAQDEERFQALIDIRVAPMRAALTRAYPEINDWTLESTIELIKVAYVGLIREAHIAGSSPEDATHRFMAMLKPLLQSFTSDPL